MGCQLDPFVNVGHPGGQPGDPPRTGSRWVELSFPAYGDYVLEAQMSYRVGVSEMQTDPTTLDITVAEDSDGDTGDGMDGEDGEDGDGDGGGDDGGDGSDAADLGTKEDSTVADGDGSAPSAIAACSAIPGISG